MPRHDDPKRADQGAVLIHVAFALLALTAFTTFVVDYGVFFESRRQAQNSADAAALAGALTLAFNDPNNRTSTGPAAESAVALAQQNLVWGVPPSVQPATDVCITGAPGGSCNYPCPPPSTSDTCIRVNVYRTNVRGNALPTFFGQLANLWSQDVQAAAAAEVTIGNASDCLRPFAVPDFYVPPVTTYSTPGYTLQSHLGTRITLKGGPGTQLAPGWFRLLDLAAGAGSGRGGRGGGGGGGGAPDVWRTIKGCDAGVFEVGEDLAPWVEQGNVASISSAINDLISLDKGASWNGQQIINSCADTNSCNKWVPTGHPVNMALVPDPGRLYSPRVIALPVFDPLKFSQTNGAVVEIVNILGFFVEGISGFEITGVLVSQPGLLTSGGGTVDPDAAFMKFVRLIR